MEKESQLTNCGVLDARTAFFYGNFLLWSPLAPTSSSAQRAEPGRRSSHRRDDRDPSADNVRDASWCLSRSL